MPRIESYAQGTPSFVDLTTPDQDAAKVFYADLFGWEYDDQPLDEGGSYSMVRKGDGVVAGIGGQLPELAGHPAWWAVYLATDDVDAAAASVVEAGGAVDAGPFDVMRAGRMAAIQDPTGARVNLWTPGDSIGSEIVNEPGAPAWNELVTPDVDAATRFYSTVLGVGWETRQMNGCDYTCLVAGGKPVGAALPPSIPGQPPHWNVYFNVESTDATITRVVELGGTVLAEPWDVPDVGRLAVVSDPQGAMFCAMQHAED